MEVPEKAEVVVIGGGVMGCSIAYQLAKQGIEVVLFEERNLASGATGRCAGGVLQLHGRDLNIDKTKDRLRVTKENNCLLLGIQEEIGDFEYRRVGYLDIVLNEGEWEQVKQLVAIQKQQGDDEIELLDKHETRELMPLLTGNIVGSRYRPSDGNLNPFKLTYGLARAAKKHKALIFTQIRVEKILESGGRVKGVKTIRGETKAKWVVNATNAWASLLTEEVYIAPIREIAMITEPVPKHRFCVFEAGCGKEFAWGTTQTQNGNLLIGGLGTPRDKECNYYNEVVALSEIRRCARNTLRLFPSLGGVNIIRSWAGTSAFTTDGISQVGSVPAKEGLIIAGGFPAGMACCLMVGKAVTRFITNGRTGLPDIYDPARFFGQEPEWPPDPYDWGTMPEFVVKISAPKEKLRCGEPPFQILDVIEAESYQAFQRVLETDEGKKLDDEWNKKYGDDRSLIIVCGDKI